MGTPGNKNQSLSAVRQPVLLGLFSGTAVGAGYLLAGIPNVELMTLIIALCGGVLGARAAFAGGALAAIIYSLGSPYGLPVPLLLAAQAVGFGLTGVFGAIGGNRVLSCSFKGKQLLAAVWAAAIGLGSTLIYDLLTNVASILAFDLGETTALAYLLAGVPLALVHMGSNAVIFASLMPLLLPRLAGLNRSALVGRTGAPLVLLALLAVSPSVSRAQAPASADSSAAVASTPGDTLSAGLSRRAAVPVAGIDQELSGPARAHGWQRPLWDPFARTALEWLGWFSNRVPVIDGGLGAPAVILGEAGTSLNPQFTRDGIPLGTGHILADDPWVIPTAGLVLDSLVQGADGWGGTGGLVATRTEDPDPGKAVSAYRGVKGKHETYFRSIYLLTPKAAWRAGFEFEESLDIEGYNFTSAPDELFVAGSALEFPGHSRVRQSRTRLFRQLDADNELVVEYTNARLTKDSLPVYGAEHLELWDDGLATTMRAGKEDWRLQAQMFWRNRDVLWGDRSPTAVTGVDLRQLETGREGLNLDLHRAPAAGHPETGVQIQATNWYVDDSLTDDAWLAGFAGSPNGEGQTARAMARSGLVWGSATARLALGADWHSEAGWGPELSLGVGADGERPWWNLRATHGGRAPRSDELLTPLRRDVAGRELLLWPNSDLDREETTRVGLVLQVRLFGFDLAADGSVSRLKNGITWQPLAGATDQGIWANDLEMESSRLTGTIGREGRFLGWGRLMLEGTWQQSDETAGRASFLPPKRYLRTHVMWENHFFKEDGILQLALFSTLQGEMADPWDVTRTSQLPSRTVHDLLVGFRLVGATLSMGLRNLTGERVRLTSGALSSGQDVDMRLHWAWVY